MAKRILPLSKIRLDGNTQPRVELDDGLIREYQEAYQAEATMPPLEVMFDGASYWLWDGFHRRWGAERAGMEKLSCNVTDGTQQDAQWASYGANAVHGLRRTNPDKQKAVKAALRHPNAANQTDERIAEHCGVSSAMVGKYRKELAPTLKDLESSVRTGRDGRTIDTTNIGKRKPDQAPAVSCFDPEAERAAREDAEDQAPIEYDEPEEGIGESVLVTHEGTWLREVVQDAVDQYLDSGGDRTVARSVLDGIAATL